MRAYIQGITAPRADSERSFTGSNGTGRLAQPVNKGAQQQQQLRVTSLLIVVIMTPALLEIAKRVFPQKSNQPKAALMSFKSNVWEGQYNNDDDARDRVSQCLE